MSFFGPEYLVEVGERYGSLLDHLNRLGWLSLTPERPLDDTLRGPLVGAESRERRLTHQSLVGEKVERPVCRRWCGCASFIGEYFKNGVSAERPVAAPDYLQHPCA